MSGQYGSSIEWFKLWRKISAKGNEYFIGRCAGAKVVVLARQKENDGDADFIVMLQAPNPQQQHAPDRADTATASEPQPSPDERLRRSTYAPPRRPRRDEPRGQIVDDIMPF
jgi:hypothetical protein